MLEIRFYIQLSRFGRESGGEGEAVESNWNRGKNVSCAHFEKRN